MAVQKNFVVRNGLEVDSNLLVADSVTNSVGIGTSNPNYTFEVIGGIGATHINVLGISTVLTEFNVGFGGTVITSLNTGLTGFGTAIPAYVVDIRSPVSTGQTALYVQGDVRVTGDLYADDISFDQATLNNLEVTGVGTIATATIDLGYVKTGIVTNLSTSGIASIATASVDLAYVKTGIVTNLSTSGIATITNVVIGTGNINTGVVTTISGSNLNYSGIGSFGSVNTPTARIVTGIVTTIDNANLRVSGIASINTGVVTTAYVNTGIVTTLSGANLSYSGIGTITTASIDLGYVKTGIVTNLTTSGIATITTAVIGIGNINTGVVTTISGANLSYSGIGSFGSVNASVGRITTGIITTLTGTTLNYSGIGTIADFKATSATISGLTTTGSLAVASGFDVYAADSTFHGNLTIGGNLSIGGTSAIINAVQVRVEDKDIILGFTTSITPSDDTANHGGVAIASTEGYPLVSLAVAGINTFPDTYKQIMWVKRNTMGAGTTDAFLFNYGVGIGSTQVPNGVRLAVGSVQISDNVINTTNLNVTGIGTIATASVDLAYVKTGIITTLSGSNLSYSGIGTIATASVDLAYVKTGIVTNLSTSGIGTIATASVDLAYVKTGIITTLSGSNLSYSGIVTAGSLSINGTTVINNSRQLQNIASLDATTTATIEAAIANAPNTSQDIVVTGIASINTGVFTSFFSPTGIITTLSGANINYSGIGSFGSVNADIGRINTGIVTNLTVSGIATFQSDVKLGDNDKLYFGDGNDLEIYHDGSNSAITDKGTGDFYIQGSSNIFIRDYDTAENHIQCAKNGAVSLYYDGSKKFETTTSGITVTGNVSADGIRLGDNDVAYFGDGNDLSINHDGSNSYIKDEGTGSLYIQGTNGVYIRKSDGTENLAGFTADGTVELYYDSVKEFETTGYGATVYGVLQSQGLNSSGIATISVNSSSDALRITQTGAGNALVVEDETNPDATPFVVTAAGNAGVGTNNPTTKLDVFVTGGEGLPSVVTGERMRVISNDISGRSGYLSIIAGSSAYSGIFFGDKDSAEVGKIRYFHSDNSLQFLVNGTTEAFRAISSGNVGINSTTPLTTLDVGGTASIKVPVGTTGERPGSPVRGFVRFNTDLNTFEGYNGTEWGGLGGAAEKDTAVSTTSATTCESFAVSTHRSATITAQITQGSNYQVGKYVVIHDGTTATLIEESAIATGSMLGSFTATISGGNLLFQVNMSSASSATVTTLMTKISV
jgi:hypothetical protein